MLEEMSSVKGVGIEAYFGTAEIPLSFLEIEKEAWSRTTTTDGSTSQMCAW